MTLLALSFAWLAVGASAGLLEQISHQDEEPTGFFRPAASAAIGAMLGGLLGNLLAGQSVPSADSSALVGSLVGLVVGFRLQSAVGQRLRRPS
jgi:uncharacterized membrane protein YeaQ/YmgE (transglycosylase-associated protein family)